MAWTYTQDFDSLTTADLNGQDSWSADTAFDVQTSVVLQGTKSISCTPAGSNRIASRAITPVTNGGVSFLYRVTNATEGNGIFYLKSGSSYCCQIVWDSGTLKGYNGATLSNLASYSANTTYKLAFVFDCATNKFDVYLDDTKVANQFDFTQSGTYIDSFWISSQAGSSSTIYFDDIKVYPPVTAVTFTISDTATLTDSFLASLDAKLTDTLTLVESVLMSRGIPFTVEDYITALDTIKLDMGLTVQDIVSMNDEQLIRLLWEAIAKNTTSWTNVDKNTTNWTNLNKN